MDRPNAWRTLRLANGAEVQMPTAAGRGRPEDWEEEAINERSPWYRLPEKQATTVRRDCDDNP